MLGNILITPCFEPKKASQIEWKGGGGYNLSSKHNSELVPSPYKTFSVDSTLTS